MLPTASDAEINEPLGAREASEDVAANPAKFGVPKENTYRSPDFVKYFDESQPSELSAQSFVVAMPRDAITLLATCAYAMTGVFVPDSSFQLGRTVIFHVPLVNVVVNMPD